MLYIKKLRMKNIKQIFIHKLENNEKDEAVIENKKIITDQFIFREAMFSF